MSRVGLFALYMRPPLADIDLRGSCVTGAVHYRWHSERQEEPATPRTAQVDPLAEALAQIQVSGAYDEAASGGDDGYNLTTEQGTSD